MEKIYLSVIIPAYNEEHRISDTLSSIHTYFKTRNTHYEVIVVDDGSTDNTVEVVKKFQDTDSNIKLISNPINFGKGYAVHCGMLEAQGTYRLFMDADNSVSIDSVDEFISKIGDSFDVVIGSIAVSESKITDHNSWYRRVFGTISKYIVRTVVTPGIYDTQRGFKLFTTESAQKIFPLQTIWRFGFDIELLAIARIQGLKIKELPVVWNNPSGSTVKLGDYVKTFVELFKIMVNKVRGKYQAKSEEITKVENSDISPVENSSKMPSELERNFLDMLQNFSVISLGFIFFEVIFITLGYILGQIITTSTLFLSFFTYLLIIGIYTLKISKVKANTFFKSIVLFILFSLTIYYSGTNFFSKYHDVSHDGESYHSLGVLSLSYGWNPIYDKNIQINTPLFNDQNFVHVNDYSGELIVRGYPKAFWMIQSSIYKATNEYGSMAVINLMMGIIALCLCFVFLRKIRIALIWSCLISFLAVTELHYLIQFFTLMQDGASYEMSLCAFALLGIYFLERTNLSLVGFLVADLFLMGMKYSNLPLCLILTLVFLIIWLKKITTLGKFNYVAVLCAILFLTIPYLTNVIYYQFPLYPANLKGLQQSYSSDGVPLNLKNSSRVTLLFYGLFSAVEQTGYGNGSQDITALKFPFTYSKVELDNLITFDTSNSSFGAFFSGILLLSLVIIGLFYRFEPAHRKKVTWVIWIVTLILLSALINPVPNVSRYTAQLFVIPFIAPILVFSLSKNRYLYFLSSIIVLFALINNSMYIYKFIANTRVVEASIQAQIVKIKEAGIAYSVTAIPGPKKPFVSNYVRLQENNIPIKIVSSLSCEKPFPLNYSYDLTMVCPLNSNEPR